MWPAFLTRNRENERAPVPVLPRATTAHARIHNNAQTHSPFLMQVPTGRIFEFGGWKVRLPPFCVFDVGDHLSHTDALASLFFLCLVH